MKAEKPNRRNKPAPEGYRNFNGNYVHDYPRPFFERNDRSSRITYNPETGVGELYYNIHNELPTDKVKTEKILGPILKEVFNTNKYICVTGVVNKSNKDRYYCCSIQFHFKSDKIPENPEIIPSIIEDNWVFQEED